MRDIRTKYQAHVSTMLKLAGFTDTDARAQRIVDLEHAIAETHLTLAENEDIQKANNPWKPDRLFRQSPRPRLGRMPCTVMRQAARRADTAVAAAAEPEPVHAFPPLNAGPVGPL